MNSIHTFDVNPYGPGGESLVITTNLRAGHDGIEIENQSITLCSYFNSATFNLSTNALTPTVLRRLADELEAKEQEMSSNWNKNAVQKSETF